MAHKAHIAKLAYNFKSHWVMFVPCSSRKIKHTVLPTLNKLCLFFFGDLVVWVLYAIKLGQQSSMDIDQSTTNKNRPRRKSDQYETNTLKADQ